MIGCFLSVGCSSLALQLGNRMGKLSAQFLALSQNPAWVHGHWTSAQLQSELWLSRKESSEELDCEGNGVEKRITLGQHCPSDGMDVTRNTVKTVVWRLSAAHQSLGVSFPFSSLRLVKTLLHAGFHFYLPFETHCPEVWGLAFWVIEHRISYEIGVLYSLPILHNSPSNSHQEKRKVKVGFCQQWWE